MTETLAEKTCTPCRGGIPPLTHEEAERFRAQASDWANWASSPWLKSSALGLPKPSPYEP